MSRRADPLDCKVYVGGLPQDATSQEIEDAFNRFGRIRKVWVARRPPGFAFVEFEDSRDAEDSVKALDGTRICGVRARVELSHGRRRNGGGYGGGGGGYGGAPRRRSRSPYRGRSRSRSRTPPPRRSSPRYDDRRSHSRSLSRIRLDFSLVLLGYCKLTSGPAISVGKSEQCSKVRYKQCILIAVKQGGNGDSGCSLPNTSRNLLGQTIL
ncbi:putative splicing factor, arginine/serine-rich 6 [Toxocara canis]|uniref:Putative splicing factor, arginine/serine-rich 6 n=1 Tax=Toxocara canis TaxID=6265 RepID=A0A0B2VUB8_TOXCA|nr:putative splicing factor, arginine/serine-rich 6 [Toxocara canis]